VFDMKKNIGTGLKVLGMVGARSGSKSVPDKNIKPLGGKPLMHWIIDAAKKSKYINRIIVSTDSEEYATVARSGGAETPFLRPAKLALDASTDIEFIQHALTWLSEHEQYEPDIVLRLLATVPMQSAKDIDGCIEELIKDPSASASVAIAEASQHPKKALKLIDDGMGGKYLVSYFGGSGKEVNPLTRQSYEKAYFRGNIIASRRDTIYAHNSLTGERVRHSLVPVEHAIDIDSPMDFFIAEQLMDKWNKR